MRVSLRAVVAALTCLAFASTPSRAAEGMWTFDNFPAARMQSDFGWAPNQAWLDRVMGATARLPGCSGANVSASGLMLTNHHCVIDCITALSTDATDYLTHGFMARTREEEVRCPNLAIQVLTRITDVTQTIDAATASVAAESFAPARDAEIAQLESSCSSGAIRCEVVVLYNGGRYALYRYKRYEDVRLVFAPEHAMAAFGGDADNFNFPRYCADFAFLRVYENGAPASTPGHLSMRFTPLSEGETVLIAGNPGATSRLRTTAELAFERDVNLPWRIAMISGSRERLAAYAALGPDQARIASSALQSDENTIKALTGRRQALADPAGFAHVATAEADLQARVHRNLAAQRDTGNPWADIAAAETAQRTIFYQYQYLEARAAERSDLFAWARDIVRGAAERQKPDAQRLHRYTEARLPGISRWVGAQRTVEPAYEAVHLQFWLTKLRQDIGGRNPAVRRIFNGDTAETLAQRLSQSRLADPVYRLQLWNGGAAAVATSDDPMIVFVRAWDADARAIRARYETQVAAPIALAQERIARARFRAFADTRYPEATFSPRLSYGKVEGWSEPNGATVGAFTRLGGLYQRATDHEPFALSQPWIDARPHLDANTILDIATSTDVIGGNSGSPLLDTQGRVVGAVFDGNTSSLGGEYFYDGALNRSVTVASTAIRAALADVYHMNALLAELSGG